VRVASLIEIAKINQQRIDLQHTVTELNAEAARLQESLPKIGARLAAAELALARLTPQATEVRRKLSEITEVRDSVKRGRSLVDQRMSLQNRRAELEALRPAGKADKPKLGVGGTVAHDFAQTVSQVLRAWHFPGDLHVSFDDTVYDLRIDGKLRRDNGKGVRAITHAAFKVALLIFCHERRLPHPGFLVLDTPLLTYRDPMDRKAGELAEDERRLAQTSLKQHFFDHLATLGDIGQFIVIENIDPPVGIESIATVEIFHGSAGSGRKGLFSA
jgi:hypothetical protein